VNRFVLPAAIFGALAVVLAVGVLRSPDKGNLISALIGKSAPPFSLPELTDPTRRVESKTLAGKPYVINVWATWCVECRAEHPLLLEVARDGRLPLIGLNWRDEDAAARQWLIDLGNPYAAVAVDADGRTAIDYGVYGAPETFFIDAQGVVQYRHVGPMTAEVWEREFIGRLAGTPSP
jgi:cytochrome c biogenesis protein CcmG, thiol:disulfide interchange protein DsbE